MIIRAIKKKIPKRYNKVIEQQTEDMHMSADE